jgi:hypothetical protein
MRKRKEGRKEARNHSPLVIAGPPQFIVSDRPAYLSFLARRLHQTRSHWMGKAILASCKG